MYSEIPKKIRQPTSIKINIENFQQFLSEFSMFIGNVDGLDISMKFSKPSATDAKFAELYSESLDGDTPTEYTRTLLRELDTAVKSYERIDTNVRTYLVSCAGTDETLRRKFINHQGDAYSLVRELATDYNKKSSNNAITEKAKMYLLTYSATTTNEEFIDKLELAVTAIENAGGKVDYDEIALRALNCAVDCERFQMKVTAYMTTNELNAKTPSWTEVKAYLLSLDRTVKSPSNNSDKPSNLKIMYTDDGKKKKHQDKKKQKNRYRFCTRESCMTRHPDGEHLDGSKNKSSVPDKKQSNAELIAAAVVEAINQDKRNRFQSRGANQFATDLMTIPTASTESVSTVISLATPSGNAEIIPRAKPILEGNQVTIPEIEPTSLRMQKTQIQRTTTQHWTARLEADSRLTSLEIMSKLRPYSPRSRMSS